LRAEEIKIEGPAMAEMKGQSGTDREIEIVNEVDSG
jgi:hypothetical protein